MRLTDEDKQRRISFAAYLDKAMRAAGYMRPNGDLDVPALHRMSGVPDSILRRWLNLDGDPGLPNLRLVAPALGATFLELLVAAGLASPEEAGFSENPAPPPAPPTPEERIMADDVLSDDEKTSLIQLYRVLRERHSAPEEPRRRKRA